jgi:hypothetical protein
VELALIDAMEPKDPFDETVDMLFETLWLLAADEVLLGRDHAVNLATVRSRSNQLSLKLAEETQWFVSSSVSISDPLKEWGKIKSIAIRTEKGFKERMEEAKKQVTKDWTVKDYYTVIKKVLEDYGIL